MRRAATQIADGRDDIRPDCARSWRGHENENGIHLEPQPLERAPLIAGPAARGKAGLTGKKQTSRKTGRLVRFCQAPMPQSTAPTRQAVGMGRARKQ
jgi:hypothetical protein